MIVKRDQLKTEIEVNEGLNYHESWCFRRRKHGTEPHSSFGCGVAASNVFHDVR
jgi:hypothetical protein